MGGVYISFRHKVSPIIASARTRRPGVWLPPGPHRTFGRRPVDVIAAQVAALGQPARIQFSISTRRHSRLRPSLIDGGTLPAAANACQWDRLQPHKAAAAVSGIRSGSDTLRGIETPITAPFVQPCGKFRRIGSKLAAGLDWSILTEPFPFDPACLTEAQTPFPLSMPLFLRENSATALCSGPLLLALRVILPSTFFFQKACFVLDQDVWGMPDRLPARCLENSPQSLAGENVVSKRGRHGLGFTHHPIETQRHAHGSRPMAAITVLCATGRVCSPGGLPCFRPDDGRGYGSTTKPIRFPSWGRLPFFFRGYVRLDSKPRRNSTMIEFG